MLTFDNWMLMPCMLQEIGLKSLVKISRGSVRIEKNPALCFVDTIDWSLIASGSKENVISNNKPLNECPTCPGPFKNDLANDQMKPVDPGCPESVEMKRRVCWNRQQCQQGTQTVNLRKQTQFLTFFYFQFAQKFAEIAHAT